MIDNAIYFSTVKKKPEEINQQTIRHIDYRHIKEETDFVCVLLFKSIIPSMFDHMDVYL